MAFNLVLLALICTVNAAVRRPLVIREYGSMLSSYDYVIVGGGTSGLTVANRLTEDSDVTVLVIEVGDLDDGEPGVLVPGIQAPVRYMRNYQSIPQSALDNRSSTLYTAQVVGGGTVINGMFFNRGSAEDYDAWEELGNPGWGWNALLPYFKKSENYTPATQELQDEYPISPDLSPHGTHGPVGSSYPPSSFEITKHFYRAWQSMGVMLNPQSNAGLAIGAFYSPMSLTNWNMSRSSASAAYYKGSASQRSNLHLLTGQRVWKIVFDGKRACGVEYQARDNATSLKTAKASKEVIIAAGAQRSPQVLQLSGVGPKALLSRYNMSVIEDLPGVGYNFQDQPSYYMYLGYNNYSLPAPDWLDSSIANHTRYAQEQLELYYDKREGAYTLTFRGGSDVAFLPLKNVTGEYGQVIDLARAVNLSSILPAGADSTVLNGHRAQQKILLGHYASANTATLEIAFGGSPLIIYAFLKPLSRGSILINSTNPNDDPVIDFGTFTHPADIEVMLASFLKTRELLASGPMQELGVVEAVPVGESDEDIRKALRSSTYSSWQHPVGTLAMMPRELGGVVDPELRVYGVESLRVVDASIMPTIPASHTSSTVYAVAEKAADLIKAARHE